LGELLFGEYPHRPDRHAVLSRLLPRLKIAARCSLSERFLVVRGDLRATRYTLAAVNLMEPNGPVTSASSQDRSPPERTPRQFLPFEGDQRLALILSKAFLLAADPDHRPDHNASDQEVTNESHAGASPVSSL